MKICSKCDINLPLSSFNKDRRNSDGLRHECNSCRKIYMRSRYDKNKSEILARAKMARIRDKDKIAAAKKIRYAVNRDAIIKKNCDYIKRRKLVDPVFKFKRSIRDMVKQSYTRKGYNKKSKTHLIIGCSFEQLFAHLKQTAINNYGGWHARIPYHLDHIIPLKTAKNEEGILKLCHYTNLQYLTQSDNLAKSGKLDWRRSV